MSIEMLMIKSIYIYGKNTTNNNGPVQLNHPILHAIEHFISERRNFMVCIYIK